MKYCSKIIIQHLLHCADDNGDKVGISSDTLPQHTILQVEPVFTRLAFRPIHDVHIIIISKGWGSHFFSTYSILHFLSNTLIFFTAILINYVNCLNLSTFLCFFLITSFTSIVNFLITISKRTTGIWFGFTRARVLVELFQSLNQSPPVFLGGSSTILFLSKGNNLFKTWDNVYWWPSFAIGLWN